MLTSALLGGLGLLFADSLLSDVWLWAGLRALAVDCSCAKRTVKESNGVAIRQDALPHGLCLIGFPNISINFHASPSNHHLLPCQGSWLELTKSLYHWTPYAYFYFIFSDPKA